MRWSWTLSLATSNILSQDSKKIGKCEKQKKIKFHLTFFKWGNSGTWRREGKKWTKMKRIKNERQKIHEEIIKKAWNTRRKILESKENEKHFSDTNK